MTRSQVQPSSSTKAAKMAPRQKAGALTRVGTHMSGPKATKRSQLPDGMVHLYLDRINGLRWIGTSFKLISAAHIEDYTTIANAEVDVDAVELDDLSPGGNPMVVSLLDIARPAKVKGLAKEYEVVDRVRHIIVLDDLGGEGDEYWEVVDDDDWEEVNGGIQTGEHKSYSAALRGG